MSTIRVDSYNTFSYNSILGKSFTSSPDGALTQIDFGAFLKTPTDNAIWRKKKKIPNWKVVIPVGFHSSTWMNSWRLLNMSTDVWHGFNQSIELIQTLWNGSSSSSKIHFNLMSSFCCFHWLSFALWQGLSCGWMEGQMIFSPEMYTQLSTGRLILKIFSYKISNLS